MSNSEFFLVQCKYKINYANIFEMYIVFADYRDQNILPSLIKDIVLICHSTLDSVPIIFF